MASDSELANRPWREEAGISPAEWAQQAGVEPEVQSRALAEVLGLPFEKNLGDRRPSREFVDRIPISFARRHYILGLDSDEDPSIIMAFATLDSWDQVDVVSRYLRRRVQPVVSSPDGILEAINKSYQQRSGQAQAVIDLLAARDIVIDGPPRLSREDLLDVSGKAPIVELINTMLFEAIRSNASDVHVQPYEDRLVVRFRIDGVLFDTFEVPKASQDEVLSRLKVIGRMNIAEKRLPQDGRATVRVGSRLIDLRFAALPTSFGERIVIRLLDKTARISSPSELGMSEETLQRFFDLIKLENGLILVTGPTGSGKSTSLYAALQQINTKDRNVVTLEDPIEYQLEGISQTQVSALKGMTFASGLRNVLRQDPDIIMVGEIRDQETAVMAIQSSLTGHLVFSTLHTNDAASAVTRLLDLGIEPYLVASSLVAVMAQRLVRQVCPQCARRVPCDPQQLKAVGMEPSKLGTDYVTEGAGCAACRNTGYQGRIGMFELLVIDPLVRDQIQARANASQIRDVALRSGMRLLRDDGAGKIAAGMTTIAEVARVTIRTTL
jgi:general secretion pathway protein E